MTSRGSAEPALDRQSDVRGHLVRVPLRRLRDRCLRPVNPRLADLSVASDRPRPRSARDGDLGPHGASSTGSCTPAIEGANTCSIRFTERLARGRRRHLGRSRGGSFDNAMTESIIGLFKTEFVRRRGSWKGIDDVEYPTLGGWIGSTIAGCSSRSVTSRRPSSRPHLSKEGSTEARCTHRTEPTVNPDGSDRGSDKQDSERQAPPECNVARGSVRLDSRPGAR